MIRNGDIIGSYTILATANGMALAHSETTPDPYVVWFIDEDGCGVRNGRYQQTKEDAEWDFCCKAFPWFEDNAPVNMIEDEAEKRIQDFNDFLDEAKNAVDMAKALVEDMVLEHGRLQGKKEAPQEEIAELKNGYVADRISKIKDEIKKTGIPCSVVIDNGLRFEEILVCKKEAPQSQPTEQEKKNSLAQEAVHNFTETVYKEIKDMLSEYSNSVSGADNGCASYCECFYLRYAAARLVEDLHKSLLANIWNLDTLFL